MTASIPIRLEEERWKKDLGGKDNILMVRFTFFDHDFERSEFDQRITMTFDFQESMIFEMFGKSRALPLGHDQAYIFSQEHKDLSEMVYQEAAIQMVDWRRQFNPDFWEVASGLTGGMLEIKPEDYELDPSKDINYVTFQCMTKPREEYDQYDRLPKLEDFIQKKRKQNNRPLWRREALVRREARRTESL